MQTEVLDNCGFINFHYKEENQAEVGGYINIQY